MIIIYSSWTSTLSSGISAFTTNNQNIYYDGTLISNINTNSLSVTSVSYSTANGLTFTITYNGFSANKIIKLISLKEYFANKF